MSQWERAQGLSSGLITEQDLWQSHTGGGSQGWREPRAMEVRPDPIAQMQISISVTTEAQATRCSETTWASLGHGCLGQSDSLLQVSQAAGA